MQANTALGVALLVVVCFGCTRLPDYARGSARVTDGSSVDVSRMIPYRALTRGDFRGAHAPEWFKAAPERLGAATCAYIFPASDLRVQAKGTERGYETHIPELRFQTRMDPECSWWNERNHAQPESYVLEHEQIHFALFELATRELNQRAPEIAGRLAARGPSAEAALAETNRLLRLELEANTRSVMQRNDRFDEDTSMGYRPEAQARWLREVQSELASSEAWAGH